MGCCKGSGNGSNNIDFFIRAEDAENTIKANKYAINNLDEYFQKIGEDREIYKYD